MKKAYNETWVDNIENRNTIKDWYDEKVLSKQQYDKAIDLFPVNFYQPNMFIEFGLFMFTNLALSAAFGFLSITIFQDILNTSTGLAIISLIYCVLLIVFLEYLIRKRKLYRSGTDNALLYVAIGSLLTAIFSFTDFKWHISAYFLVSLLVFIPFLIRYGDPFVAVGIYVAWIALWFSLAIRYPAGKDLLPFIIMGVSAVGYFITRWWQNKNASAYYADAQICIEAGALITFYVAGNYWFVREGNAFLNNLATSVQIKFALLFYVLTVAVPAVYLVWGLKKQDRKMVLVGVAAAWFDVFTFRFYFSEIPIEWAMTIGGAFLASFAVWGIWFFKTPKWGLTSKQTLSAKDRDFEAFLLSQVLPHQTQQGNKMKFGDGEFGGSGSGSRY
ncbi:hypothetical protein [Emticicia sp. TH156]|uniref:hypothetical protein n=1 Tax=Emticicia sp. TH156 TaxID=2067454 RepID=UPI000C759010|nr:hypothetical protein [Emticicia sp. TH156]PLK45032.1 hypothetical protein C0V77_07270 [Emticicia sp. TH156]